MKQAILFTIMLMLLNVFNSAAQVPVREEPRHKPVLVNKYFRLLDVWLKPGDTTLFHIHALPSLFVQFTNTRLGTQVKGEKWVKSNSEAGSFSYRSFTPDSLIHRVSNWDRYPFHVTDVEILSSFEPNKKLKPLKFSLLDENEKFFAYRITRGTESSEVIKQRGPMIAEVIYGKGVTYNTLVDKKETALEVGGFIYIAPGTSFYFSFAGIEDFNVVLLELK